MQCMLEHTSVSERKAVPGVRHHRFWLLWPDRPQSTNLGAGCLAERCTGAVGEFMVALLEDAVSGDFCAAHRPVRHCFPSPLQVSPYEFLEWVQSTSNLGGAVHTQFVECNTTVSSCHGGLTNNATKWSVLPRLAVHEYSGESLAAPLSGLDDAGICSVAFLSTVLKCVGVAWRRERG